MLDISTQNQKSYADGKILKSVTDGVGIVTFNNPEKRNAMSIEMWEGLGQALIELREDDDVRVVILTGAGDKAFMSGADISQFEKNRRNAQANEEYNRKSAAQRTLLAEYPKPTIACIRGFCLGGGMQVAMLADIRFADHNSQFGIPAAKLGIAYGFDGLRHLVSLVGPSWARLILYTGMRIDSAEALRIGLVDRVAPADELVDTAVGYANELATACSPWSMATIKQQVAVDAEATFLDAAVEADDLMRESFRRPDIAEGLNSFAERRSPAFAQLGPREPERA